MRLRSTAFSRLGDSAEEFSANVGDLDRVASALLEAREAMGDVDDDLLLNIIDMGLLQISQAATRKRLANTHH